MIAAVSSNQNAGKNAKYIANTTLNSALLGGIVQSANCLAHAKTIKKTGGEISALKSIKNSIFQSALLGFTISSILCMYNFIKSKINGN